MAYEGEGGEYVPRRRDIPHYHGDSVRWLFVLAALIIVVARSTSAEIPLSTGSAVVAAVVLVIAAGITSPRQGWIHWVSALLAIWGTLLFGMSAVEHYRAGVGILDPTFIYTEVLALLSLMALYLTTRTIRGILTHRKLI